MQRNYHGILTKTATGYILFNYQCELNLNNELKSFWKTGRQVHIKIDSDDRILLNENCCDIYYDRDNKSKKYQFHINGRNIEKILEHALFKQLYITIEELGSEDWQDDTDCRTTYKS